MFKTYDTLYQVTHAQSFARLSREPWMCYM